MIELTAEAIKDYQVCSLYYDLKHIEKQPTPIHKNKFLVDQYHNTFRRILSYFFLRRQADLSINYNLLVSKWEKLWFPKDMDAYDLMVEQQDKNLNLAHFSNLAVKALLKFYDYFKSDTGYPSLVDEPFTVPFSKSLKLSGVFDLVLEYPDNHYKIIKWVFDKSTPIVSDHMLGAIIELKALTHRNLGKDKLMKVEYLLYNLESTVNVIPINISQNDINASTYWIKSIEADEIFAPRRGLTSYCRGCPFDSECIAYSYPNT